MKLRRQLRQCTCGAKHTGFAVGLLLRAAEKGNLAALTECLEDGEDVTQTASNRNTALHWAAFHGFADMIEVLAQTGGRRGPARGPRSVTRPRVSPVTPAQCRQYALSLARCDRVTAVAEAARRAPAPDGPAPDLPP